MTDTIPALLTQRAAANGSSVVLRKKDRGLWKAVAWSDLDSRRRAVAAALRTVGFRQGDIAGILSETTPDAVYVDLGILSAGGVSLALHPEAEADQVRTDDAEAALEQHRDHRPIQVAPRRLAVPQPDHRPGAPVHGGHTPGGAGPAWGSSPMRRSGGGRATRPRPGAPWFGICRGPTAITWSR